MVHPHVRRHAIEDLFSFIKNPCYPMLFINKCKKLNSLDRSNRLGDSLCARARTLPGTAIRSEPNRPPFRLDDELPDGTAGPEERVRDLWVEAR